MGTSWSTTGIEPQTTTSILSGSAMSARALEVAGGSDYRAFCTPLSTEFAFEHDIRDNTKVSVCLINFPDTTLMVINAHEESLRKNAPKIMREAAGLVANAGLKSATLHTLLLAPFGQGCLHSRS